MGYLDILDLVVMLIMVELVVVVWLMKQVVLEELTP